MLTLCGFQTPRRKQASKRKDDEGRKQDGRGKCELSLFRIVSSLIPFASIWVPITKRDESLSTTDKETTCSYSRNLLDISFHRREAVSLDDISNAARNPNTLSTAELLQLLCPTWICPAPPPAVAAQAAACQCPCPWFSPTITPSPSTPPNGHPLPQAATQGRAYSSSYWHSFRE